MQRRWTPDDRRRLDIIASRYLYQFTAREDLEWLIDSLRKFVE